MVRRNTPPFRADHVGSLLRPKELLQAREEHKAGRLAAAALRQIEDDAIAKAVKMQEAFGECERVASADGHPPTKEAVERTRKMLSTRGSTFTASMMRDLVAGGTTEHDHIIGDLVRRGERRGVAVPVLRAALANLQVQEARRKKEA